MEPDIDTRALVEAARTGDRAAFDRLVERFEVRLSEHVASRLGARLKERIEPDDVIAQTWATAWKGITRFEWKGESEFLGWLRRVAERTVLNVARARRPDEVIYLDVPPEGGDDPTTPSRALRREERFERLEEALEALEPDQREAVMLVRIEGLKLREAAERMGRSSNAVMHLLRRALDRLRERFDGTVSLGLPDRPLGRPLPETPGRGAPADR